MKDSENPGCSESNWGYWDNRPLLSPHVQCFKLFCSHSVSPWGSGLGYTSRYLWPYNQLLNKNCKLDPYGLFLGVFPYSIWSFQPVCISECCLSFTNKKLRQKGWVALFKTAELLPWPWAALSSDRYLDFSSGYLKNLIMDLGFIEYAEIFCWWLYSVTSFGAWVQLLHLCIGSANVFSEWLQGAIQGLSHSSCSLLGLSWFLFHDPLPAFTF